MRKYVLGLWLGVISSVPAHGAGSGEVLTELVKCFQGHNHVIEHDPVLGPAQILRLAEQDDARLRTEGFWRAYECEAGHRHVFHDAGKGTTRQFTPLQLEWLARSEDAGLRRTLRVPLRIKWSTFPDASATELRSFDWGYHASQAAFLGSAIADVATTWSLPKGWAEGNPILGRTREQQLLVSSASAFIVLWKVHRLEGRGNTKAARYLLWLSMAMHAGPAVLNASR